MSYGLLKTVHMSCAMASFGLFVVRESGVSVIRRGCGSDG